MMKKTIILLSSVLASALVVGGAFATYAYAVTDNAGTLTVDVTPGELQVDDTKYVTLEWGQETLLNDLGKIQLNTNYKVGVVELVSSIQYTGVFQIHLEDVTTRTSQEEVKKLIDYLNVYVYAGDKDLVEETGALPAGTAFASSTYSATATKPATISEKIACDAGEASPYSIFIAVDNAAAPYFTAMTNDVVRITVDWNQDDDTIASGKLVYFTRPSDWSTSVHLYAFGANGENSAWPGVAMEQVNDDLYSIVVPSKFDTLIFNDGVEDAEYGEVTGGGNQTAESGIKFTGYSASAQHYDVSTNAWTAIPVQKSYYLVGKFGEADWNSKLTTYKFGTNPQNPFEYVVEHVELKQGDEVKVAKHDGINDPGNGDWGWTSEEGDNFVAPYDGTFTMYFTPYYDSGKATSETQPKSGFGFAGHLWIICEDE